MASAFDNQQSRPFRGGAPTFGNKQWIAGRGSNTNTPTLGSTPLLGPDGKWERGGHAGGGRGRGRERGHGRGRGESRDGRSSVSPFASPRMGGEAELPVVEPESIPVREKTWEELNKAREAERERAIKEGKMDDPNVPKRLEDAITMVGTCQDMCPEYERYRRERQNNLDRWEMIIGPDGKPTKKVDHKRAVKIYERGQGDKIIPSDLRPAPVLKRTLDYLFHDLIPRGGFAETQAFVRDRSRAVRNDFTIQQDRGPIAMECHERCTRFHILSLHLMLGNPGFDRALEIQQCMNSLLSLKEFYDDQRDIYQSPNELEMRIYHRLGLIRDQHERNDKPPPHIAADPAFQLITRFRAQVQEASKPITKISKLNVSPEAMATFGELAGVLRERGNVIMIYLIACFLEHIFGKGTIEDMDAIVTGLTIQDIIDGNSNPASATGGSASVNPSASVSVAGTEGEETGGEVEDEEMMTEGEGGVVQAGGEVDELDAFIGEDNEESVQEEEASGVVQEDHSVPSPLKRGATQWLNDNFGAVPTPPRNESIAASQSAPIKSAFGPTSQTAPTASTSSPSFLSVPQASTSVFGRLASSSSTPTSVFGRPTNSLFGQSKSVFGLPIFGVPKFQSPPQLSQAQSPQPQQTTPAPSKSPTPAQDFFASSKPSLIFSGPSDASTPGAGPSTQGQKRTFSSLADQPPLSSDGDPDKPSSTFVVKPDSPLPASKSMSTLNPSAPAFSPFGGVASDAFPKSTPIGTISTQKPTLAPLRTDSLSYTPPTETPQLLRKRPDAFLSVPSPTPSGLVPNQPETPGVAGPLKINTGVGLGLSGVQSTGFIRKSTSIDSPIGPPPLNRPAPISLPGTPIAQTQSPAFPPPPSPNVSLDAGSSLLFSGSVAATSSPFRRFPGLAKDVVINGSPVPGPSGLSASKTEPTLVSSTKDTAGEDNSVAMPTSRSDSFMPKKRQKFSADEDEEELIEEAESHRRRVLLSRSMSTWQERLKRNLEWKQAVKRSDEYKEKSLQDMSVRESPSFKRSRELSTFSNSSYASEPQRLRRRLKSRMSTDTNALHRTDEMLAKRLQEKRDENERRWARGTFLKALTAQLHARAGKDGLPSNWRTWLCTNPDSEHTSVWLEQKFDVPNSGVWESDMVFSIFCEEGAAGEGYPGLIVFECTALDGLNDDIERKYRVLDDCARLREVCKSMKDDQHYVPSLLLLSWDADGTRDIPGELAEMIQSYGQQGKILDYRIHHLTTSGTDLETRFADSVGQLKMDLEGLLVEKLLLSDIFEQFAQPWLEAISVWIEACNGVDECDWRLLAHVLGAYFTLLLFISKEVVSLWGHDGNAVPTLPLLNSKSIQDADSTQMAFRLWLQSPALSEIPLARHLSSFDFSDYTESRNYLTQICAIFLFHLQRALHDDGSRRHIVPKSKLAASRSKLDSQLQQTETYLKSLLKTLPRRPSRRALRTNGAADVSMASSTSIMTSPSPPPPPSSGSVRRLDTHTAASPDVLMYSAPPSPIPSQAPSVHADTTRSFVSASALRALAQSVLKTYGGGKP